MGHHQKNTTSIYMLVNFSADTQVKEIDFYSLKDILSSIGGFYTSITEIAIILVARVLYKQFIRKVTIKIQNSYPVESRPSL